MEGLSASSEHNSSLFDTVYWTSNDRSSIHPHFDAGTKESISEYDSEDTDDAGRIKEINKALEEGFASEGARFISRPHGTPLYPILERRSSATLRSRVSRRCSQERSQYYSLPRPSPEGSLEGRHRVSSGLNGLLQIFPEPPSSSSSPSYREVCSLRSVSSQEVTLQREGESVYFTTTQALETSEPTLENDVAAIHTPVPGAFPGEPGLRKRLSFSSSAEDLAKSTSWRLSGPSVTTNGERESMASGKASEVVTAVPLQDPITLESSSHAPTTTRDGHQTRTCFRPSGREDARNRAPEFSASDCTGSGLRQNDFDASLPETTTTQALKRACSPAITRRSPLKRLRSRLSFLGKSFTKPPNFHSNPTDLEKTVLAKATTHPSLMDQSFITARSVPVMDVSLNRVQQSSDEIQITVTDLEERFDNSSTRSIELGHGPISMADSHGQFANRRRASEDERTSLIRTPLYEGTQIGEAQTLESTAERRLRLWESQNRLDASCMIPNLKSVQGRGIAEIRTVPSIEGADIVSMYASWQSRSSSAVDSAVQIDDQDLVLQSSNTVEEGQLSRDDSCAFEQVDEVLRSLQPPALACLNTKLGHQSPANTGVSSLLADCREEQASTEADGAQSDEPFHDMDCLETLSEEGSCISTNSREPKLCKKPSPHIALFPSPLHFKPPVPDRREGYNGSPHTDRTDRTRFTNHGVPIYDGKGAPHLRLYDAIPIQTLDPGKLIAAEAHNQRQQQPCSPDYGSVKVLEKVLGRSSSEKQGRWIRRGSLRRNDVPSWTTASEVAAVRPKGSLRGRLTLKESLQSLKRKLSLPDFMRTCYCQPVDEQSEEQPQDLRHARTPPNVTKNARRADALYPWAVDEIMAGRTPSIKVY